jgi:hypothetical protein
MFGAAAPPGEVLRDGLSSFDHFKPVAFVSTRPVVLSHTAIFLEKRQVEFPKNHLILYVQYALVFMSTVKD